MKNIWHIADDLNDKYEKRNKSFDDLEDFDDFAIENLANEQPLDEILSERKITLKEALSKEKAERDFYDKLANKLDIKSREFPRIWIELIEKCENCPTEDNIKLLLWLTAGEGFTDETDSEFTAKEAEEQLIRRRIGIEKRVAELESYFCNLRECVPKFAEIISGIDSVKTDKFDLMDKNTDDKDVERVFSIINNNGFSVKSVDPEALHGNLMAISLMIGEYDFLKPIKPLVYFQVYVRQHKKLLNNVGFIPNLKSVFQYREYGIFGNNEKNFNQYAEYCRLYILLKSCFPDADEELCDTGFLYCSNLASWYHELGYIDYSCDILDGIPFTTYAMVREMNVFCFDKPMYADSLEKLEKWRRQYRNLYIEAVKAVDDIRFEELGEFAELGERYCERFFNEDFSKCVKNENHQEAAWGLLVRETERRFDELLEQKICGIFDKYYINA